jgi:AcrR family transcriptional regulator
MPSMSAMKMLRVERSSPGAFVTLGAVGLVGPADRVGLVAESVAAPWVVCGMSPSYAVRAVTAKLQFVHRAWHHEVMSTDLLTGEDCGLRERKKRETRRSINLAALDLVETKGYAAVTTEEIAARAGVSARTFFNYFPSKEAAVIGTTAEELEGYAAALEEATPDESPLASLRRILAGMLAPASVDRDLRARRRRILLGEPALAPALVGNNIRIENALTAALERRLGLSPGASLEPRLTVAVAIAAVRACIEHQQNGGSGRLERNVDAAFDRIAAGLA